MSDSADLDRAVLVALLRARPRGLTWSQLVAEVVERGNPRTAWEALRERSLFDIDGETPRLVAEAARDIAAWTADGLGFHTFLDDDFPAQLREIHQMPPVLFSRGTLLADDHAVAVVGSRRASEHGLRLAQAIAEALVDAGITVVSGLAEGIDTSAHVAALNAGGRTVAVIGTGISRAYPPTNERLQERIAADGLVLSQFWPESPPTKSSFPMRNATMSGYGRTTIIVEAGEVSGARIQARVAVEHGRPVILTDAVVQANEWARRLTGSPGVHVASSPDEMLAIVAEVGRDLEHVLAGAFSDAST